jgi:glycosyltransferase involved in cell wall biosynthesis
MRKADKIIMFNVSLKGMPAWLLSGKALYLSHHTALWYDGGPRPWQQRLKQWVANHLAKKNCACSGYIASLYQSCEVIYSPFRSDVFTPGNLPRIPGSILFAGRLVSDKGADLLLEACAILKAKGITFSLTIVGDGPDRQKLIALAEERKVYKNNPSQANKDVSLSKVAEVNIPGNIGAKQDCPPSSKIVKEPVSPLAGGLGGAVFPAEAEVPGEAFSPFAQDFPPSSKIVKEPVSPLAGGAPQPELVRLMQTHEVLVVPSRMEPMGMVVAEGLACGCRMVVSNQGGMPEVGGRFCHYFESGNAAALADALETAFTSPLPVNTDDVHAHLHHFTIEHSVAKLEKWLA